MTRLRMLATLGLAALVLVSCGDDFDPDDPRLANARIVIVGSPAVNMRYGEVQTLTIEYQYDTGEAIGGAPIDWALEGTDGGARLAALQTTTDGAGRTTMMLTAGNGDAMFMVRVSPPTGGGSDAVYSVAVADTDLGSIVVNMTYAGMRTFTRFDAFLFDADPCAGMDPRALPTALRAAPTVTNIGDQPAFAGVPVGSRHTIGVTGTTAAGVAAFGCRDNISVTARTETAVNITLMDVELVPDFTGVWDLDNQFDLSGGLPPTVQTALDVINELTDDRGPTPGDVFCYNPPGGTHINGRDPGAFFVDIVARQTCAWECMSGDTFETCSAREYPDNNHRLGDIGLLCREGLGVSSLSIRNESIPFGCGVWDAAAEPLANLINTQLAMFLPDWVFDWAIFSGDLARAIQEAQIASVLTINAAMAGNEFDLPMIHELLTMTVLIHDPLMGGVERSFTFSMADAGITGLEVMDTTTITGTTLNIPEHSFTISFGDLVQYIYFDIFLNRILGYTSSEMMLMDNIDCMAVGEALEGFSGVGGFPTVEQGRNACNAGLRAAGRALDSQLAGLIDADAEFTISGTTVGGNIDESTGRVGTLDMGMWTGFWGDSTMSETLSGTFTGTRR